MQALFAQPPFVTLPGGGTRRAVRLNNAATSPPLLGVLKRVNGLMEHYGAVERGSGPLAQRTAEEFEEASGQIRRFTGTAGQILFSSNTTGAINDLCRLSMLGPGDVVLTSEIEHTSNYLPWRVNTPARIEFFRTNTDGSFDFDDLYGKIDGLRPAIVSITGAHSLTGYIPPLREIARRVHDADGRMFVDCAQLAPHRPLKLKENGVDFAAFSAHKVYAPFGTGVLTLPQEYMERASAVPGGGTVDMIGLQGELVWKKGVAKHQGGTPNVVGVIALAEATKILEDLGWGKVISHERQLTKLLAKAIQRIPKIKMYVAASAYGKDRTGNIVFNLNGLHHSLVSAILHHEYGIETRAGTICSHRLVRRWAGIDDNEQSRIEGEIRKGNLLASYGIVRASVGLHNSSQDVKALSDALCTVASAGPKFHYNPLQNEETFEVLSPLV